MERVNRAHRRARRSGLRSAGWRDDGASRGGEGYPSLFAWCTHALRLSEPAAYSRITAARTARRYPLISTQLADGDLTLTTVTLLAAHLNGTPAIPAVIVDRALTVLVEQLETSRRAAARRPQVRPRVTTTRRHVPASVRRAVWARDDGRCAFVGADGRCRETGWLELHHVVAFARGGPTTAGNLELQCRAHNAYEAEREFGGRTPLGGGAPRPTATLSGQSLAGVASRSRSGRSTR